ncbi:hypothetical protein GB931_18030 [Modestobacter sp. I12A-02628]|uniref:Alkaline phosphatase n=1 Tax=Goekera deserti TaxID=2497753 RepID=A0A7K3W8C8_9ACTN|nr:hypothetical protein [Goekera deserti]MPQ99781.1 hypothetical protein [Goekera deserti]NDI49936.1 hypothetical protein [Goekera deserti]NEL52586.1 hypothetical protein [Goekera deserti]
MVRRGNTFIVRGQGGRSFSFGDAGDTVLVGDWDGDGTDALTVRRGNRYFVENDIDTGVADHDFSYGDAGDTVLVGNGDGDTSAESDEYALTTDTLAVRRGNRFFIRNDTETGVADLEVTFGDARDTILVGDWGNRLTYGDDSRTPQRETDVLRYAGPSGDHADQFAVRRGNHHYFSDEVENPCDRGSRRADDHELRLRVRRADRHGVRRAAGGHLRHLRAG